MTDPFKSYVDHMSKDERQHLENLMKRVDHLTNPNQRGDGQPVVVFRLKRF